MDKYIHIWEVKGLSIKLNSETNSKFWLNVINHFGSQYKLADFLDVGQYTISRWLNGKLLVPIDIILRLIKYSRLNTAEIESSILAAGSAQGSLQINIRFPLKFTEDVAYLAGLVITDGHINKDFCWVQFSNNEEKLKDLFKEKIRSVFNHNSFYLHPKHPIAVYVKNKTISKIFWTLGIPKGNKSNKVFVPKYIFYCKKIIIKSFLRACFDGDGCVSYTPRRGLRIINYATSSKQMAEGINALLSSFGVKNSISKNIKNMYYINITGRENLEMFKNEIGFNHPKRSRKLDSVLKSYFLRKPL